MEIIEKNKALAQKDKLPMEKMTQFEILKLCYIDDDEIEKFVDPEYFLKYFPAKAK
jgi:hypothetical protein